jgi:hypothetical protein
MPLASPLIPAKRTRGLLNFQLDSPDMPPSVAGGSKFFLVFGVLALLFAPILLLFLVSEREKGALTYVLALVMFLWATLALLTAWGINTRKSWSQPLGIGVAVMLLCPLLAFVAAPPGLLGGILMAMAGILVGPAIGGLINLSKPDWKQWYAGSPNPQHRKPRT